MPSDTVFPQLPYELWAEIISFCTSKRDLANLCSANSMIGFIASKHLYSHVRSSCVVKLAKLYRSVSRNLNIAAQIIALDVNLEPDHSENQAMIIHFKLQGARMRLFFRTRDLLPNLKSLDIQCIRGGSSEVWHALTKNLGYVRARLSRLTLPYARDCSALPVFRSQPDLEELYLQHRYGEHHAEELVNLPSTLLLVYVA
ncbi:hypothetical protein DACRYDRAFT_109793 [Dacryopinax primogenitus]|uniref:F-box domain-containing protein n=1 Tax=Dacryopinax primogenitus (strain DJM 731) TaxID=1858805 RepID=M5FU48_DACPD|nr:uncharacterized protein DACRYDRAFT_109793 [Dacryopinax primogenitus]EJT99688.1 hypothetical protein DACRYDRAFT_109793 [Dacryopinax primogenitus]